MHLKLLRAAAAVAVLGGTATFGLGVQAALASPTPVPCGTDLTTVITSSASGEFSLARGCTYVVTGQLTVMNTVIIDGHNASIVRSHSADPFSVFVVGCAAGNLTLNNVNVRNGGGNSDEDGGAVDVTNRDASLTINGGTYSDNNVTEYGGAIYNYGTMTVNGATFTDNSAEYGGAIYSDNYVSTATLNHDFFLGSNAEYGGAIYNDDNDMTIGASTFHYNSATGEYGEGGAIYNDYDVTITGSGLLMNSADTYGGAIYNSDDSVVTLSHSLLATNRATDGGGAVYNYEEGTVTLSWNLINANIPDNCEPTGTISGCLG
ncbi:MAG: hypothetical protein ACRDOU_17975 [Streptosporangiaceae bacterium]